MYRPTCWGGAAAGGGLVGDGMFAVILRTRPTPVISKVLDLKSGRMLGGPKRVV